MNRLTILLLRFLPGLLLCVVFGSFTARAQYTLKLGAADFTLYPKIQIPFEIIDNSSSIDTIRADAIKVFENGIEMLPVEVECGGHTVASKIHFMFVMDASLSMAFKEGTNIVDIRDSVKWRTAKRVFADAYKKLRSNDEGALSSFAADYFLEQNFTMDKKLLTDATMGMALRSGTAIYDAIATSVGLLEQRQGKRVIILLTDGVDNSSSYTLNQAVNLAWGRGIPVHVIGLGFYLDQTDPFRVDKDTLQKIADGTSGKAYFTSKSEELAAIFERIIDGIYSVSCVARYTAPDTCEDGSARIAVVQANVRGTILRETMAYTLPDLRSRMQLSAGFPGNVTHDRTYTVPITVDGELRAGQPLDLGFTVRFDPSHLDYQGLDPAGGVLNNTDVSATVVSPGEIRFATVDAMPVRGVAYGASDALVSLRFHVMRHETLAVTSVSVAIDHASQTCVIVAAGATNDIHIFGCPPDVQLVLDTAVIAPVGEEFVIPVMLTSVLDMQQALKATVSVYFGPLLEYRGYDIRRTVLQGGNVVETKDDGIVTFDITSDAPALTTGILIYLRFKATKIKEGTRAALTLLVPEFTQFPMQTTGYQCPLAVSITGADVWIDGMCSPLLKRKSIPTISAVFPAPAAAGSAGVDISFTVNGTEPVDLSVIDAAGKIVNVLAQGVLPDGTHGIHWYSAGATPGLYMIVLRQGDTVDSRKLLISR